MVRVSVGAAFLVDVDDGCVGEDRRHTGPQPGDLIGTVDLLDKASALLP